MNNLAILNLSNNLSNSSIVSSSSSLDSASSSGSTLWTFPNNTYHGHQPQPIINHNNMTPTIIPLQSLPPNQPTLAIFNSNSSSSISTPPLPPLPTISNSNSNANANACFSVQNVNNNFDCLNIVPVINGPIAAQSAAPVMLNFLNGNVVTLTSSKPVVAAPQIIYKIMNNATMNNALFQINHLNINNMNNVINQIPSTKQTNQNHHAQHNHVNAPPLATTSMIKSHINNNNKPQSQSQPSIKRSLDKPKRGRKKIDRTSFLNTKGRYQCTLCVRSYKRFNDLKGHWNVHESKTKGCPYCGKKFSRPVYLNDHIRSHTGEKPFQCTVCLKKFGAKRNLTQHKKIHLKHNVSPPISVQNVNINSMNIDDGRCQLNSS